MHEAHKLSCGHMSNTSTNLHPWLLLPNAMHWHNRLSAHLQPPALMGPQAHTKPLYLLCEPTHRHHTHKAHLLSCVHMSHTSTNLNPWYLLAQPTHPDQCRSVVVRSVHINAHWPPSTHQTHCIFCVNQLINLTHIRLICSHVGT